jgi:hypothetical protein
LRCLQEIGVQIEEPFGILALEVFCDNICRNIKQAQAAAAPLRQEAQGHLGTAQVPLPLPLPASAASISTVAGHSFEDQVQPAGCLVGADTSTAPSSSTSNSRSSSSSNSIPDNTSSQVSSSSSRCYAPLSFLQHSFPPTADSHSHGCGTDEHDLELYVGSAVAAADFEDEGFTM